MAKKNTRKKKVIVADYDNLACPHCGEKLDCYNEFPDCADDTTFDFKCEYCLKVIHITLCNITTLFISQQKVNIDFNQYYPHGSPVERKTTISKYMQVYNQHLKLEFI